MSTDVTHSQLLRLFRKFAKHIGEGSQKAIVVVRVLSSYYSTRFAYYGRVSGKHAKHVNAPVIMVRRRPAVRHCNGR